MQNHTAGSMLGVVASFFRLVVPPAVVSRKHVPRCLFRIESDEVIESLNSVHQVASFGQRSRFAKWRSRRLNAG